MTSNPDVPPFTGYVETTVNALRLIHAARQGVIPRITRRLNDSERRSMIKSGAVFVFSVEESGIKRWTDGLLWSPSRIVGNFLVYREINERTSSRGNHKKPYPSDDSPTRALPRKSSPEQMSVGFIKSHGALDHGTFKAGGLVKKTITVTIEGSDLHLISYYTPEDIRSGRLKRPSSRSDIMSLYMPPDIFRLTNFRVPPKIERGPDGKPRLMSFLIARSNSENEDVETVDCKVEDQGYNIPASPTWSNHSPTTPVENGFGGNAMYPLGPGQGNGGSNGYGRGNQNERWSSQNDSNSILGSVQRQDMNWSPTISTLSSGHSMSRRRESNHLQSDTWPSIHSQSTTRWQAPPHEPASSSSANGLYQDRSRARSSHPYEDGQIVNRRDNDSAQHNLPVRYTHPNGTREGALQRLHWHSRDTPDHPRDLRRAPQSNSSFSPSPTMPFTAQGYHTTYSSPWTSPDANLLTTPTLHSIATQPAISYDGTYTSHAASASISSPEEYASVEDYQDS
ncbi:hypothetical protein GALMADRAFT_93756 [Galerina marginata CBS 339.88]|uniref:Gti1/Pac2 family protein n=1 Tax=Galerina marginata (strain CBS 339.88) TaxID=685588 RepID=A0A067T8J0_GALM3|nr:hypothetical protein GALMADRAFT_93756 [Galerina marginata CBS 339.88]